MLIFMALVMQVAYSCIPTKAPATTVPVETTKNPECVTVDINPGRPCVFPFTYQYHQHDECIPFKGKFWCALTSVYNKDAWGYCDQSLCPPTKVQPTEEPGVTPGPGSTTNTAEATTTEDTAVERGHTSMTLRDGESGFLCDVKFSYTLDKTFQLKSELLVSCKPTADLSDSSKFLEEKNFILQTSEGVDLDCTLTAIFSNEESGTITVSEKAVHKSLRCSVSTEMCLTNNGSVFPSRCAPTFRYNGREYHGCTDKNITENTDRLWCATSVDSDHNMIDGQWGYCSSVCSFCSGSPVNNKAERSSSRPCGYDCIINPKKRMKGFDGTEKVPLLSPDVSLSGDKKDGIEVGGQFQLTVGEQTLKITCPMSTFVDPKLRGHQTVFADCGPLQYHFTVYSVYGELIDTKFKNDQFGCGPCPNNYNYIPGYISPKDDANIGTSFNIPNVHECEDECYDDKSCQSFSYSAKERTCQLFSKVIAETTLSSDQGDYTICAKDAGCCETMTLASTGGSSQVQSHRLGKYVQNGRHNNRIVYKQEGGSNVLYYPGHKDHGWVVSSGLESLGVLRSESSTDSVCPSTIFLTWKYWSGSAWIQDDLLEMLCNGQETIKTKNTRVKVPFWLMKKQVMGFLPQIGARRLRNQAETRPMLALSISQLPRVPSASASAPPELQQELQLLQQQLLQKQRFDRSLIQPTLTSQYGILETHRNLPTHPIPFPQDFRTAIHEIVVLSKLFGLRSSVSNPKTRIEVPPRNYLLHCGVYEILAFWKGQLYDNLVGLEEDKCTEVEKEAIKLFYNDVRNMPPRDIDGISYDKFEIALKLLHGKEWNEETRRESIKMKYNALLSIFWPEHDKFFTFPKNYHDTKDIDDIKKAILQKKAAFLADKYAIALFCEAARNPEVLTLTLMMIQNFYEHPDESYIFTFDNGDEPYKTMKIKDTYPHEIHPTTFKEGYFQNREVFETRSGDNFKGAGLRPVISTVLGLETYFKRFYKRDQEKIIAGMFLHNERVKALQDFQAEHYDGKPLNLLNFVSDDSVSARFMEIISLTLDHKDVDPRILNLYLKAEIKS